MSDEVPLPGQAHNGGVRNSLSNVAGPVVQAARTGPVTINVWPAGVEKVGTTGPGKRHTSFGLAVAVPAITLSTIVAVGLEHDGSEMVVAGSARPEAPDPRPGPTSGVATAPSPGTDRLMVEVTTRNDRFPDFDRVADDSPQWTEDSGAGDLSLIDNGIFDLYATGGAALVADQEKEPSRGECAGRLGGNVLQGMNADSNERGWFCFRTSEGRIAAAKFESLDHRGGQLPASRVTLSVVVWNK